MSKGCSGSYLEVDDDHENGNRGQQLQNIGQAAPVKGLLQGTDLRRQVRVCISIAKCHHCQVTVEHMSHVNTTPRPQVEASREYLVASGEQKVEESDDGAFKLNTTRPSNGVRGEGLPDNALADVSGNEEGDSRAKAIAMLQHLIKADDDDAREEQLQADWAHSGQIAAQLEQE